MLEFDSIYLVDLQGMIPGKLTVDQNDLMWKECPRDSKEYRRDGKVVQVNITDVTRLTWMEVYKTHLLGVYTKLDRKNKFGGFKPKDVSILTEFFQKHCGIAPQLKQCSVSGKNRGTIDVNGGHLYFLVDENEAFEVALSDVSRTIVENGTDVILQFDTNDEQIVSLNKIIFHVPESHFPAMVLRDKITQAQEVKSPAKNTAGTGQMVKRTR